MWASHTRLSARATSSSSWRMEANGLVHREVYAEVPPRVAYSLTELGKSLKPILDSM
ncbi:winged helix-turn-helix transcriptional regulator [Vescimonas sp.]